MRVSNKVSYGRTDVRCWPVLRPWESGARDQVETSFAETQTKVDGIKRMRETGSKRRAVGESGFGEQ